jgi:type I restriction enzyme, R subunit
MNAFFSAIRAAILKYTTVDRKRTEDEKNSELKQILDNAVIADGASDIFALAALERPNIGLLSDEFLKDFRNTPAENLAVELLERLLRDEIRSHTRGNLVQQKNYTDRLLETPSKYHNRAIEAAQVIEARMKNPKSERNPKRKIRNGWKPGAIREPDARRVDVVVPLNLQLSTLNRPSPTILD